MATKKNEPTKKEPAKKPATTRKRSTSTRKKTTSRRTTKKTKSQTQKKKSEGGNLTPFTSENQPDNNGRRKKLTTILKDEGYSISEIRDWFRIIATMTTTEVQAAAKKDEQPVIVRILAKAYLSALKKGDYTRVKEIVEQVIGRPSMKSEVDLSGLNIEIVKVPAPDPSKSDK